MTKIELEVLEIIRKTLNNEEIDQISDWNLVLKELKNQAVFCLPYSLLMKSNALSSSEKKNYKILCLQSVANNIQLLNAQAKLVSLLQENDIPFVILKGTAAAMYYSHPEYRTMGDIDLIVKPEDFDRAHKVLEKEYELTQKIEDIPRHATFTNKEGHEIELHKYFSILNNNKELDDSIYKGIELCEIHSIREYSFPTLPPIENGMVLLYHIYQHLEESGIGYRQVIDFREFLNKNKEIVPSFLEACEKTQLRGLAEIMITLCNKYLGLEVEFSPKFEIDESYEEFLFNLFSSSGNFGKKEGLDEERKAEIVLKDFKNPIRGIKILQRYGLENWKASKKFVVLRPFAWMYQLGRYVNHAKEYGGVTTILKGTKRVNDKNQLFRELKLPKNY